MNKKELLLEAIEQYGVYSAGQRKILKTLVTLAIDDTILTNSRKLSALTGVTQATIHNAVNLFLKDEVIKFINPESRHRMNKILLINSKLNDIIERYENEKQLSSK